MLCIFFTIFTRYSNVIYFWTVSSWTKRFWEGSVPTVCLAQTPGRVIQNDYKSCNMDVRIDTSRPLLPSHPYPLIRPVSRDRTGLLGRDRLVWTGWPPVSPGLNPLHPDFPLPPLPHSISIVFSHRTLRGERWEGKRDSWLAIFSKDGATCTTWTVCHLINKRVA